MGHFTAQVFHAIGKTSLDALCALPHQIMISAVSQRPLKFFDHVHDSDLANAQVGRN